MEKLSELSKPVGFVSKQAQALLKSGDTASVRPFFDVQGSSPLYSQEYVSALLAELEFEKQNNAGVAGMVEDYETKLEAKDKRIDELEAIRADASQVFKEIGNELGCNPDNESIMMAIDELKATQMTGPLALIIKRAEEMERILEGITPEMIAGGWTAKGISDYAKSLEAKLATPVRLPKRWDVSGQVNPPRIVEVQFEQQNRTHEQCAKAIRDAGFTVAVEGDE